MTSKSFFMSKKTKTKPWAIVVTSDLYVDGYRISPMFWIFFVQKGEKKTLRD